MLTNTDLRIRVKIPIDAGLCVTCGEPRLSTDGQTLKCRHCSGESLLSEWNRTVARFVREAVRRVRRGAA